MDISDLINSYSKKITIKKRNSGLKISLVENISLQKKSEHLSSKSNVLAKIFLISFFVIIFIYIFKLYFLQILNFEKFNKLAERNYIRSEIIYPNRGLIYDRNGQILVKNVPKYILNQNISKCVISKNRDFSNCRNQLETLKKYLEFDIDQVVDRYSKNEIITIKRELIKDEAILVGSLRGVGSIEVSVLPQREYTYAESFSHLLGYVGPSDTKVGEYEGKMGVEGYYQNFLSGISGSNLYKSDSMNSKLDTYQQISPVAGKNIKLTIDADLQNFAFGLLKDKVVASSSAIGGVVIAQDPRNGDILALVNYPTFDLNKMTKGLTEDEYQKLLKNNNPFLNRAISGVYPPGSVFKIVTASGILQEGVAKPDDKIFDEGFIKVGESVYGNWKRDGHGTVDFTKSMKVSNDTYYYIFTGGYKIPRGLGIAGLYSWGKRYKFGEMQGIDLYGESEGFMPDGKYKTWYLGDTFISAIGQGDVLATPLQVSSLVSYYANNQITFRPRVVLEADNLVKKEKVLYENLISNENFAVIKNSLKEVNTTGGTGYPFFDFKLKYNGVESAGKTGTSEYFDARYQKVLTHAWYSGFAPYDQGEIVVTVFLESGGGGADDAAPIARKVMDYYFEKKNKK